MSAFAIKILAFIFMLGDHLQVLYPDIAPLWLRLLGRFSFPVFAYFIGEGMIKTRSRERYLIRLFILAALTEAPYDLCFGHKINYFADMNVVWTLLFGAALIYVITMEGERLLKGIYAVCLLFISLFLGLDYGVYGVVLTAAYYFLPQKRALAAVTFGIFTVKWLKYVYPFGFYTLCWVFSCLGFALPCLYNGEKGREPKHMFYFLYLGHILVLILIKRLSAFLA